MPNKKKDPIYHRVDDSSEVIELIVKSGKLMGRPRRGIYQSEFPKAKANFGPLPKGERGFEFTTDLPPDSGCVPERPSWSNLREDVETERIGDHDYASIPIKVLRVVK